MTIEDSRLQRIRVAIESGTSAYGVDQSGSLGNFLDLPVVEGSVQPTRNLDHLDPQSVQQWLDKYENKVLGKRSSSFNFSTLLAGHGILLNGIPAAPSTTTWALARVLQTIMGSMTVPAAQAAQTQVQAASTVTVINVTAGHGVRFPAGTAIGCVVNGRYEYREVLSRSTDAISVKVAFSGLPGTGTAVRACVTFAMTEDPQDALQFVHEGYETSDRFVYMGLQGGFSLDVSTGALPKLGLSLNGCNWAKLSSLALASASAALFAPVPVVDSEFIVGTVGSTTRNLVHAQNETWSPGITYTDVSSPAGNNTIVRKRRTRNRLISGSFQPYRDQSSFDFDAADLARTRLAFFKQIGSSLTDTGILLSAPSVQILAPQKADNNGLSALSINWEGSQDEALAGSSDLLRSAFRIHFF